MAAETITVLFTDLVGSTELLSRVGEARADDLRREHFGLLRMAVDAHGGREVKNLGDGLMVVYAGVTAALESAVAMQQAIAARPPDSEPLSITIGVAVGDAELEDGDYFGLPVVEAARLCAAAKGGEILTTAFVRMLARSRSDVELEAVGALELKGLDEPTETFRVRWVPLPTGADRWKRELPARLAATHAENFVGREAEHDLLVAGWKDATTGSTPWIAFVSGEPGIGKSTLAARLAGEVHDDGGLVLFGRCDEDLGIPYQPWIEAVTQLVAAAPEELLRAHVADRGAHLARLVPDLARRAGVPVASLGDGDAERFVLFGCVIDLLERASAEIPALLVLDDLHWSDRPSVQLLRHVVTTDRPLRVGILATFRDSEVGADHPVTEILAALHRNGGAARINLHGLNDLDLLALLQRIAGHEMDEAGIALRDAVLAETNGNPFFVVEILRHLAETGAIQQDATGRWVTDVDLQTVGLPVSVREVVGRRIATLGGETERLLTYAAVIGRDFDTTLLASVTELDEDTVIDVCDGALDAAVLSETDTIGRYTFAHALIEHTLYERLSPTRRARAHRAVAEHLEDITAGNPGGRVGELAYHWAAAVEATDVTKAVRYAQLAGDRALDQFAPDEAIRWYGQALEYLDRSPARDPRERIELLVGLGTAQRQTGNPTYRETLLDAANRAEQIDAVDLLVRAALANNRGSYSSLGERDQERIDAIDRALERLDATAGSTADRARLLAIAALEHNFGSELSERLTFAEEAIAAGRASGDPAALAWALQRPVLAISHPLTLAARTAWLDEACAIVDRLDDPAAQYWAYSDAGIAATQRADGDALEMHFARADEVAVRVPDATIRWDCAFHRAWRTGLRGDVAAYDQLAEAALTFGVENGEPDAFELFGAQLVNVRECQGRLHEIVPLIEEALLETPDLTVYRAVLALAKAHAGDTEAARQMVADAAADGFPMHDDQTWSTGLVFWAAAAERTRAIEAAPALRQMLTPYHEQVPHTGATFQPVIAHYLGLLDHLLGDHDAAEDWFTEALELHGRVRSPILVAQTQAAWSALLADRGTRDDHERARVMATDALTAATESGYGYIERDARAVLERLR